MNKKIDELALRFRMAKKLSTKQKAFEDLFAIICLQSAEAMSAELEAERNTGDLMGLVFH